MVVCLVRLMPPTVCSYPMASSTWSCPKASMSLMWICFRTCNWTVCCMYWTGVSGVGSTGVMGANATICLSEVPVRLHYTCHCTQIQTVLHWEGFKDSSISADSGHERVGMVGGGGSNLMSPSRCSCIYSCILVLKLHLCCVEVSQCCVYTHG